MGYRVRTEAEIKYPCASWYVFVFLGAFVILILFAATGLASGSSGREYLYKGQCTVVNYGLEEIRSNMFDQQSKMWGITSVWKIYWLVYYSSLQYPRIQSAINEVAIIANPNQELYSTKDLAQEILHRYSINNTYICGLYIPHVAVDNNNVYKANVLEWNYRDLTDGYIVAIFGGVLSFVVCYIGLMMFLYVNCVGDWLEKRKMGNITNKVGDCGTTPV